MKKQFCAAAAGTVLLCGILTGCGPNQIADESGRVDHSSRTTTTTTITTTEKTTTETTASETTKESGLLSDAEDIMTDIKDDVTSILTKATSEITNKR